MVIKLARPFLVSTKTRLHCQSDKTKLFLCFLIIRMKVLHLNMMTRPLTQAVTSWTSG